uniref:Uncharacterized protein n=1 Tax=Rhizochromulina marina TaxID=1034831 RepID=A0A7S2W3T9_9STRA|mmetsp:Transcript_12939/g.37644  ORF Transcript_12939/g.37644 Transcript_12939/m.37644 type:complete len:473 (+) Transcript_12939:91-1509(+)
MPYETLEGFVDHLERVHDWGSRREEQLKHESNPLWRFRSAKTSDGFSLAEVVLDTKNLDALELLAEWQSLPAKIWEDDEEVDFFFVFERSLRKNRGLVQKLKGLQEGAQAASGAGRRHDEEEGGGDEEETRSFTTASSDSRRIEGRPKLRYLDLENATSVAKVVEIHEDFTKGKGGSVSAVPAGSGGGGARGGAAEETASVGSGGSSGSGRRRLFGSSTSSSPVKSTLVQLTLPPGGRKKVDLKKKIFPKIVVWEEGMRKQEAPSWAIFDPSVVVQETFFFAACNRQSILRAKEAKLLDDEQESALHSVESQKSIQEFDEELLEACITHIKSRLDFLEGEGFTPIFAEEETGASFRTSLDTLKQQSSGHPSRTWMDIFMGFVARLDSVTRVYLHARGKAVVSEGLVQDEQVKAQLFAFAERGMAIEFSQLLASHLPDQMAELERIAEAAASTAAVRSPSIASASPSTADGAA